MIGKVKKSILYITLFSITFSICFVPLGRPQSEISWPDFNDVPPIMVDTTRDAAVDYDILSCRVTFDNNYLYINLRVLGAIQPESIYIWLDTDGSSSTGNGSGVLGEHGLGAEYYVHPTDAGVTTTYLYRWEDSTWERNETLSSKMVGNSVGIGIRLSDLGSPTKINMLFMSNTGTDYAPDEGFIALNLPAKPRPINWLWDYGLHIILAFLLGDVAVMGYVYWRDKVGRNAQKGPRRSSGEY